MWKKRYQEELEEKERLKLELEISKESKRDMVRLNETELQKFNLLIKEKRNENESVLRKTSQKISKMETRSQRI